MDKKYSTDPYVMAISCINNIKSDLAFPEYYKITKKSHKKYVVPEEFIDFCIGNTECLQSKILDGSLLEKRSTECLFWSCQLYGFLNHPGLLNAVKKPKTMRSKQKITKKNVNNSSLITQKQYIRNFLYRYNNKTRTPLYWTLYWTNRFNIKTKPKCLCKMPGKHNDDLVCINPWHYDT